KSMRGDNLFHGSAVHGNILVLFPVVDFRDLVAAGLRAGRSLRKHRGTGELETALARKEFSIRIRLWGYDSHLRSGQAILIHTQCSRSRSLATRRSSATGSTRRTLHVLRGWAASVWRYQDLRRAVRRL